MALSLFPEEDGTVESPVVENGSEATEQAASADQTEAEQEWLVADVPDETTAVEPEAEPFTMQYAASPAIIHDAPAHVTPGPEWGFDSRDGVTVQSEPLRSWDTAGEDTQSRRPWLIVVVVLVLVALAYGTWNSLQGPAAPAESAVAQPEVPTVPATEGAEAQVSPTPGAEQAPSATPPAEAATPNVVPQAPVQRNPVGSSGASAP